MNKSFDLKRLYVQKHNPNLPCLLLFSPQLVHRFYELIDESEIFLAECKSVLIQKLETEHDDKNQNILMMKYENILSFLIIK